MTASVVLDDPIDYHSSPRSWERFSPLLGIASAVLFIAGVVASSPPNDSASDAKWIANYAGSHRAGHVATGVCLVLAGICLLSFMTVLWTRIAEASRPRRISPLPMLAAGVAAAAMAVGGLLMAGAVTDVSSKFAANADLLRFSNDVGFVIVAVGAMLATALSVGVVTVRGRRAGLFGRKMGVLGAVTAVALLASFVFLPIAVLLIWLIAATVLLMRNQR